MVRLLKLLHAFLFKILVLLFILIFETNYLDVVNTPLHKETLGDMITVGYFMTLI